METLREDKEQTEMENIAVTPTDSSEVRTNLADTLTVAETKLDTSELPEGTENVALVSDTEKKENLLQQTEQGVTNADFQTDTKTTPGTVMVPSGEEVIHMDTEEPLTDVVVIGGDSKSEDSTNVQSELTSEDSSLIQEAAQLGKSFIVHILSHTCL